MKWTDSFVAGLCIWQESFSGNAIYFLLSGFTSVKKKLVNFLLSIPFYPFYSERGLIMDMVECKAYTV